MDVLRDREAVPLLRGDAPLDRLAVDAPLFLAEVERLEPPDDFAAVLRLAPPVERVLALAPDFARDELARELAPADLARDAVEREPPDLLRELVLREPLDLRDGEPRPPLDEPEEPAAPELLDPPPLEASDHLPDITR